MTRDLVGDFVRYQQTGQGFNGIWVEVAGIIREFAERQLVKMHVTAGSARAVDECALADVVEMTTDRLRALSKPNARGRFEPAKTRSPGMDGFRGWLWRVTRSKAVDWVRKHRPSAKKGNAKDEQARGRLALRKVLRDSDLAYNKLSGGDGASILKRQPSRLERIELLPILEESINQIEDPKLRQAVGMMLDVSSTERDMAERLNTPVATFHRRLHRAYAALRPILESRGVEASWFGV
jgi:DNA-directed RNA polymerase specialized sigma24 family protein